MSWVDVVIAVVVIVATERGLQVGAIRQASTVIGVLTGTVIGTIIAPRVAMHVTGVAGRAVIALSIITLCASLGAVGGRELARLIRVPARHRVLSTADRVGGAISAALGALIMCWLVAGLLANTSALSISRGIGESRILTVLNSVMPPVPSVASKVQALLRTTDFPSVFASVVAPTVPSAPVASPMATAIAVGSSRSSVAKVTASGGCSLAHEGTSFAVAPGEYMTAAHVVAGARTVRVGSVTAVVVLYDPRLDVAVLRTRRPGPAPLSMLSSAPRAGTPAAIVGYPLDLPQRVTPAAIAGSIHALGRDIYDSQLIERSLVVLSAAVQPGDSGAPVMVGGRVAGMVFSRSTSQPATAYAVAPESLRADLARAGVTSESTGTCLAG